jgi:TolB-like protein
MLSGRLSYRVKEGGAPADRRRRRLMGCAGGAPFWPRAVARAGATEGARWPEALLEAERALQSRGGPRRRGLLWGAAAALLLVLAGAAALRLSAPRAPPARIPVAVADFANETGQPDLNGLSGMLITSLEQSRHLRVLTRARMFDLLRQMGKEPAARIDEVLGRELGRKAGVQALVLATIRRFDEVYAIEMQVLDPATDQYLFAVKGRHRQVSIGLIDRLSERPGGCGRRASGTSASGRRATTASLEAYGHYSAGSSWRSHPLRGALAEFRRP